MGAVYLGIDIGTTSTKCLAVDEEGEILAFAQHPYELSRPHEGWAEQDAEEIWRAFVSVVRACVEKSGRRISAMAMSTQGDTPILVDDKGVPVLPAMSWMDSRAEEECKELLAEAGASFWYKETGQPLTPLSSACKIRWLARHAPDMIRGSRCSYVGEFLAKRLCGEFVADVPSASWTPLYSPIRREWSEEVISLLGLTLDKCPRLVESGAEIGVVCPEVSEELGIEPGVILVGGAFDQAAAAHGAGATAGGRSILSCGTAWVLYSVASGPPMEQKEQLCICCHTSADEWGLVLPFAGGSVYDWVERVIGGVGQLLGGGESSPLYFIPHLYGGLSPDWCSSSRGSLLGLTMSHTGEDIRLAVMKGVACEARRNLEAALPFCGAVELVRMVGGAGKSDIWPQVVADVLNLPVEVSPVVESACLGAARLAGGLGCGGKNSGRIYQPNHSEDHYYRRYVEFYEALVSVYSGEES